MLKNIRFKPSWLLFVFIFLVACGRSPADTEPSFEASWIRAIPSGSRMTAGFGTLHNPGPQDLQILSFSSPAFGDVSLHRTEIVDGVSKMREMPAVSIQAGGTVTLEPGGYHLMLMMPAGDIQPGQFVVIEMMAADGRSFSFEVPVERR